MECYICSSNEISDLGKKLRYNDNMCCDKCIDEFCMVCTCDKPFKCEPKQFCILYSLGDDPVWTYADIDPKNLMLLLKPWSSDYFIIQGCRGCKYKIEDIQKRIEIGFKAAVEACVYQQIKINDKFNAMKYVSDALDDDFLREVEKIMGKQKLEELLGSSETI